jgi:hypothetical protein
MPEYLRVASAGSAKSIILSAGSAESMMLSVGGTESMMLSDTLSTVWLFFYTNSRGYKKPAILMIAD